VLTAEVGGELGESMAIPFHSGGGISGQFAVSPARLFGINACTDQFNCLLVAEVDGRWTGQTALLPADGVLDGCD
jgi:hypothetical protein